MIVKSKLSATDLVLYRRFGRFRPSFLVYLEILTCQDEISASFFFFFKQKTAYEMWGLTRAYSTGYSTVPTAAQMKTYADTVVHEITLSIDSAGAATYASFNDRCCSTATYNYLPSGFVFLTPYNTDIYKPFANADINSGRQANSPGLTSDILWAKHWIFSHSQPPDFSLSTGPASHRQTANGTSRYPATTTPLT